MMLERALRAGRARPTRFHTDRGRLMPVRAWLALPVAVAHRLRGRGDRPWLHAAALGALHQIVRPETRVLELGAGGSTVWFARRAADVLSFETSPAWAAEVRARLFAAGHLNCRLELVEPWALVDAVAALPAEEFDVVLVDNKGDRVPAAGAARHTVAPGGWLVLDDSDRAEYADVDQILTGWEIHRVVGIRPSPLQATETTLYRRPQTDRAAWTHPGAGLRSEG